MKPLIGITTGCLCGIGPEIVSQAIKDPRVLEICTPKIFGGLFYKKMDPAQCGMASMASLDEAIKAAMTKEVSAIVTAPINKSHWKAAGSPFLGHTEYLAHITGSKSFCMMMVSPRLKVSLVTTHLPLFKVAGTLTAEKICEVTRLTKNFLDTYNSPSLHPEGVTASHPQGVKRVSRIAVCALNPHAGDSGALGNEEEQIIIPAVKQLQADGIDVTGPLPADTIFHRALNGEFAAVVAMYHDQALIPIKTLDFKHTVNVTIGLPFIRTSVDHGTAEDIAGKGIADHGNLVEAIKMAVNLCRK
jgi:4-hydroxythreonine-4-phosphate dehydrogenase